MHKRKLPNPSSCRTRGKRQKKNGTVKACGVKEQFKINARHTLRRLRGLQLSWYTNLGKWQTRTDTRMIKAAQRYIHRIVELTVQGQNGSVSHRYLTQADVEHFGSRPTFLGQTDKWRCYAGVPFEAFHGKSVVRALFTLHGLPHPNCQNMVLSYADLKTTIFYIYHVVAGCPKGWVLSELFLGHVVSKDDADTRIAALNNDVGNSQQDRGNGSLTFVWAN